MSKNKKSRVVAPRPPAFPSVGQVFPRAEDQAPANEPTSFNFADSLVFPFSITERRTGTKSHYCVSDISAEVRGEVFKSMASLARFTQGENGQVTASLTEERSGENYEAKAIRNIDAMLETTLALLTRCIHHYVPDPRDTEEEGFGEVGGLVPREALSKWRFDVLEQLMDKASTLCGMSAEAARLAKKQ